MVTLTKAQQQQYKEELAHAEKQQRAKEEAEYRHEMEEQYGKQPSRRTEPTAYEKIKHSAGNAISTAGRAANAAYDVGAHARVVGHEIGQNPRIRDMRSQSGFINAPVQAQPRHPTSRQQYQGAPVNDGSVMHPGNTTYIIKCTNGQCEMTQRRQRPPRAPRAQRGYAVGLLGGNDPGL